MNNKGEFLVFKSYNFWVRLMAVLVLLARIILSEFGIVLDSGLIMDIATLVASILVVVGVIKVPSVSGNENFGGEFMENFEKIKQDILKAKEKIFEKFGDTETTREISGFFAGVLGEEVIENEKNEEVTVCAVEDIEEDTPSVVEEEIVIYEDEADDEILCEEEDCAGEEPISSQVKEEEVEIDEEKLKEVLKDKLKVLIDKEFDDIISKVII